MNEYTLYINGTDTRSGQGDRDAGMTLDTLRVAVNGPRRLRFYHEGTCGRALAGIGSSVRLYAPHGQLVFDGAITSADTRMNRHTSSTTYTALGLEHTAAAVSLVNPSTGVPVWSFDDTDAAAIVAAILDAHADTLRSLGAAPQGDSPLYARSDLDALQASSDEHVTFENLSVTDALNELAGMCGAMGYFIDPATRQWQLRGRFGRRIRSLTTDEATVIGVQLQQDISDAITAVELVGEPGTSIAYADLSTAKDWNAGCEATWTAAKNYFDTPDAAEVDDHFWVYRRYRFDHITDLADDRPVQLLQKVLQTSGLPKYVPVETMAVDMDARRITARYPMLRPPYVNNTAYENPRIPGQASGPDGVYLRYHRYTGSPAESVRHPAEGYEGTAHTEAAVARTRRVYVSDQSCRTAHTARRVLARDNHSRMSGTIDLHGVHDTSYLSLRDAINLLSGESGSLFESSALAVVAVDMHFDEQPYTRLHVHSPFITGDDHTGQEV